MDIPITGFIVEDSQSGDGHAHKLYITSWDGQPVHVHPFSGITSYDVGHQHHYAGYTEAAPSGVPHVHQYNAETSFDDGHKHMIHGTTGAAVPLPGGGHYHHFRGYTTVNGRQPHTHAYGGDTGMEEFAW